MAEMTVVLRARRWLAPGILEVRLSRPAGFAFLPGQFVRVAIADIARDYTMVSAADGDTLDVCIAVVDEGRFSRCIRDAAEGTALQLNGPHGHFVFQGPVNPAVFVATGTGVAPFVAFTRSGEGSAATLLHGVDRPERLIYGDLLRSRLHAYVPCISQAGRTGTADRPADAYAGRVTDYLADRLAAGRYDFYLCGRRAMIRDATAVIDRRFGDSRLFIETYD